MWPTSNAGPAIVWGATWVPGRRARHSARVLALLCPGQGAQSPGMLEPWLEVPGAREHLDDLAAAAGADLVGLGTTAGADAVRDTAAAQPLIVAASLASFRALGLPDGAVGAVAGHSVGEIAAAALAGVLTEGEAMALVAVRGSAMARAAAATPTGMSAVVGGERADVEAAIAAAGASVANVNATAQVVAAGTAEQLAALAAAPPARARVVPLAVAGAFHTAHMAPAVDALAAAAAALEPREPTTAVLTNADGAVVADGAEVLARLVAQVSHPVRWDACQESLLGLGVTGAVELSPGGTLAGLARRSMPGVEVVALRGPEDLPAARELAQRHADRAGTASPAGVGA